VLARKIAAAKKEAVKARAGKNSLPPTPFLFARPSGKVLIKIQNLDFRQSRFGFCPKGTAIKKPGFTGFLLRRG